MSKVHIFKQYKGKCIKMSFDIEDFIKFNDGCLSPGYQKNKDYYAVYWRGTRVYNILLNPPKGLYADHIDRNPLNNCKDNLRLATFAQNQANKGPEKGKKVPYKGVSLFTPHPTRNDGRKNKYNANISVNGTLYYKSFATAKEAALWYNEQALKHYGEFAYLNVIEEET